MTIRSKGSENGTILLDIAHVNGARITLEKDCDNAPFAITWGIYGLMFHTHYEGEQENAHDYLTQAIGKINRILDLYDVEKERRDEYWQSRLDRLMADI